MATIKSILFGGAAIAPWFADLALTALRIVAGLAMAGLHGWAKMPPDAGRVEQAAGLGPPFDLAPAFFAWVAACGEFFGGLLLAAGLLTRLAALAVMSVMIVAGFIAHAGDPLTDRELAMLFGFIALAFVFVGSGRYSIDQLIR